MPRTWVVLSNEDLRTLAKRADDNGRTTQQELNYLIAQVLRRKPRRRAEQSAQEADAA